MPVASHLRVYLVVISLAAHRDDHAPPRLELVDQGLQ